MAVTPALAAVITSHAKSKERVAACVKELDSLWESLLSNVMTTIVKTTNINLERAITLLHREKDATLQSYFRSESPLLLKRKAQDQSWRELDELLELKNTSVGDDRENAAAAEYGSNALSRSPDLKRRRVESSTSTAVPVKEENVDYRGLLETMKSSLAMQARTLELLAKEKQSVGGTIGMRQIIMRHRSHPPVEILLLNDGPPRWNWRHRFDHRPRRRIPIIHVMQDAHLHPFA
ncbi:hypothetical protein BDR07DRAFT_1390869 [Suillus spraguei]|nr:hypothetical protein BDR07DRAFT_1390869 [Suillus spraguei]